MATRFYLNSADTSPVSASQTSWDFQNSSFKMAKVKAGTTIVDFSAGDALNTCLAAFVSAPIGAQTISGTLSGVVSCIESTASANAFIRFYAGLYHASDSSTETLLALTSGGTEYGASFRTRILSAATLTSRTAANGDRLIVEIGLNKSAPGTATMRFGDSNASDFALTSDLTTDLNPWVEFSANIADAVANSGAFFQLF